MPREESVIMATAPVIRDAEGVGTVRLSHVPEPLSRRLARYSLIALFVVMAVLVAAVLGLAHRVLGRANRELEERAGALADAHRELKVQIDRKSTRLNSSH